MADVELIRQAIATQGRRLDWIAARLTISQSHLSNMLTGRRRMPQEIALRLADILSLPAERVWSQRQPAEVNA